MTFSRLLKYLISIVALICTSQVFAQTPYYIELRWFSAQGKVKSISDETSVRYNNRWIPVKKSLASFNQSGHLTEEITYDVSGEVLFDYRYEYSLTNKLLREEKRTGDSLCQVILYQYDSQDSLVVKTDVTPGRKPTDLMRNVYRNNALETEQVFFDFSGTETSRYIFTFNKQRNLLQKTKISKGDTLTDKFEYTDSGKLSRQTSSKNGKLDYYIVYSFDEKGNKTTSVQYDGENVQKQKIVYSPTIPGKPYNEETYGKWDHYEGGTIRQYDPTGNLILYWGSGRKHEYENYVQGNWTTEYEYEYKNRYKVRHREIEYW